MVQFNLASLKSRDTVLVTNADEEFNGTELADSTFSIEVSKMKREDKIDLLTNAVDDEGKISNGKYSRELFIRSITDVDGFINEHNQPITLDDGIREIIWEYGADILVEKVKSVIQDFNAVEQKKSELSESDSVNTPDGQ